MIILTDKLAIKSDQYQWILCKPCKITDKTPSGWQGYKYYTSLEQAAKAAAGILLRTSEYDSFAELSSNAREISRLLDIKLKDMED